MRNPAAIEGGALRRNGASPPDRRKAIIRWKLRVMTGERIVEGNEGGGKNGPRSL